MEGDPLELVWSLPKWGFVGATLDKVDVVISPRALLDDAWSRTVENHCWHGPVVN